jgi:DNA replication protein DnaC
MDGQNFELLKELKEIDEVCSKHSVHLVQFRNKKPFCKQCKEENIQDENERIAKEGTEAYLKRTSFGWLDSLSIFSDETLRRACFDTYQEVEEETKINKLHSRRYAGEYLKGGTANTLMSGNPGSGKSHLAMSIIRAVNENSNPYRKCLFVSVDELMRLIKDSITNKQSLYTEQAMVDLLTKADLLVLDDIGSETGAVGTGKTATDFTTKMLYAIMNGRMGKPTIITTNLTSKELERMYDPKLLSRMYKSSAGHVLTFKNITDKRQSECSHQK